MSDIKRRKTPRMEFNHKRAVTMMAHSREIDANANENGLHLQIECIYYRHT